MINLLGHLFLIPTFLGFDSVDIVPVYVKNHLFEVRFFVVENLVSARRFLVKMGFNKPDAPHINECVFLELNKHTANSNATREALRVFLEVAQKGKHIGLLSEAGCPAVADPGSEVVAMAHALGMVVVPLVGASAIMLALMASGFNGQQFAFAGYLPIENHLRIASIKKLEARAKSENQTQIFIETPYRNQVLLECFIQILQPNTRLCVACNVSHPIENQIIVSKFVKDWRGLNEMPNINKKPAIFLFL